jgi:hypothetical protein
MVKGYEYQSDFAKKHIAQGRDEARARSVLIVLRARGFAVPDVFRERILTERDPDQLQRWLERAIVAVSLADVLDEPIC